MHLGKQVHLGYCTNIHRGETWDETFAALRTHTFAVREVVSPGRAYGIGLRLGNAASMELAASSEKRDRFRDWLEQNDCYLYTINGFPFGTFHGSRVKEQVYRPDWTSAERLDYTCRLFDLLLGLAPDDVALSVSTLPGSFKEFIQPATASAQMEAIRANLLACSAHIDQLRDRSGRDLHLGLEPEPLGLFETSAETIDFFEHLTADLGAEARERVMRNLGVNYDTCHLAVEFEEPAGALGALTGAGIRLSKIHLSSALTLKPVDEAVSRLVDFQEGVYLHQVVVSGAGDEIRRFRDLPDALAWREENAGGAGDEWRVHFHIPLHSPPQAPFGDTRDHLRGTLDFLRDHPGCCEHFEMETYTWEVMPEALRSGDVVDQLVAEYYWCLAEFSRIGLT